MTGFSDTVMAEIIGGGVTIVTTLITALFAWLTNRPAPPESSLYVPDGARATRRRRQWGFRVHYLWIPIVFGACVIVTLISMLGVRHEARQNLKKILYDSPEFHMNMGDQYAAMGDFASAELEYYQAIEDDGSDALAHDKRAVALAKDGRLEEALEENITACALAPDVAQYHNNKGVTLFEMGDRKGKEGNEKAAEQHYKNAVEACETAIQLDSTVADYHFTLSYALASLNLDTIGNMEKAFSECTTALQLNPNNAEYHRIYSIFLYIKGQREKSLDEVRKAIEIAPNSPDAYYTLGGFLQHLNQFDEAISTFRQAIQLTTDENKLSVLYNNVGNALCSLGRYHEALKECETGIALGLSNTPYQQSISYYNAAYTLIKLNRYKEALPYVEQGIEIYPDNPNNHYLRYTLLTYFNRHEEAEQERQAAYDLGLSEEEYT